MNGSVFKDLATRQIKGDQDAGRMLRRKLVDADYVRRRALPLPEEARYDWIMMQATSGKAPLPRLVTDAMKAIEAKFEPLKGVLPKEYGIFEPRVLEDLMRLMGGRLECSMFQAETTPRPMTLQCVLGRSIGRTTSASMTRNSSREPRRTASP